MDIPDINLWVALVDKRHVHHDKAQAYWAEHYDQGFAYCRITMLGFLRVVTNPIAVLQPKSAAEAWALYQDILAIPQVQFLTDPIDLDFSFQTLTVADEVFPHRLWTDAYLAAFAMASSCRIVSFDDDFARFPGLMFLHLKP